MEDDGKLTSPPSSSSSRWKYDVFLNFRGEDTRKSFTDHLYTCLEKDGIITFRDDEKLKQGNDITSELSEAIRESRCSIIVFSKTYAFSRWCLNELVEIFKQNKERGHQVFPIFYHVDPSDLRNQTGSVQEAFAIHEKRYNKEKTQEWRHALSQAADICGWHLKDGYESEFITDVVKKISAKLGPTRSSVPNNLIGICSRLDELCDKIKFGEDDVRIVGICGMGGIGKTTLAKIVYTQMSSDFEDKCHFTVSMESELVSLQKKFLSEIFPGKNFRFSTDYEGNEIIRCWLRNKKVLVVIDDAVDIRQLQSLAKREWFGFGSRIIITTRNEHLLRAYRVDDVYKPTTLNDSESLQLLSLKAFDSDEPENDFMSLSQSVVEYADGLPLALEVLGSYLRGRDALQWRSAIEKLERYPKTEIHDCLQISFDGLDATQKKIFLDIAHFFNKLDKDFVTKILYGCGYFPDINLNVLAERSLITIEHNRIWMHDLLQEMGRYIVREESLDDPGKRSRLSEEDVYHVLTQNSGTEMIEGMVISGITREQNETFTLSADAFLKMKRLRLLIVHGLLEFSDLIYLSNELRVLGWLKYPLKSLPWAFHAGNLVVLLLPHSCIEQLWEGDRPLNKLKVLDLQGSRNLIRTPDFTMIKNLESLILEGCTKITDVHSSIAFLPKLKLLNLRNCKRLRSLPVKIGMESLETLILSGCSYLQRFSEIVGKMECLLKLCLDGTGIEELPLSFGHLSSLVFLDLRACTNLESLPSNINGLKSLKVLDVSGCPKLKSLPENLQQLEFLEPTCKSLSTFQAYRLELAGCKSLRSLPELPSRTSRVGLEGCASLETVPNPTKAYIPSSGTHYYAVNCFKLAANANALRMLKGHLKAVADARLVFDILIPGSESFEWFSHQSEESSVSIPLPPNLQDDSDQWLGIALCCVLMPPSSDDAWSGKEISSTIIIHFGEFECEIPTLGFQFNSKSGQISKDHLWLRYLPRHILDKFLKEQSGQYQILRSGDWVRSCTRFEILFNAHGIGSKVKKCGARLVYEGDMEEMDPTIEKLSTPTSPNFDDIHQHTTDRLSKKRERY